jgi:hypothetical protein
LDKICRQHDSKLFAVTIDEGVAGYNFEVQALGWGHGHGTLSAKRPIRGTLRAFSAEAFDVHADLQACDPTLNTEPQGDGLALCSLAGARQFFNGRTRDRGRTRDALGRSLDDPDRDGVLEEISAGDLDLIEWYQLNHPAPAEEASTPMRERGRKVFQQLSCTRCHVPDWHLEAARPEAADYTQRTLGDRRFMALEVAAEARGGELRGRLRRLTKPFAQGELPRREAFTIRGVYSDFAHHDLGPAFHQIQFDGSLITHFKTAPLWGVATTAPYGHDGASLDLESAIRRHGGEAQAESRGFAALPEEDRQALLAFLRGLVLYSVDDLPCDVDGDGLISESFQVAGQDTGIERLNPEWLFRVPGRIEGWTTNPNGVRIKSLALTNLAAAYGGDLRFLTDRDGDGFADVPGRGD